MRGNMAITAWRRSCGTSATTPGGNTRRWREGLTPAALPTEGVTTVGASFYLTPNIVFKADYQWFTSTARSNRLQLGLGLNY